MFDNNRFPLALCSVCSALPFPSPLRSFGILCSNVDSFPLLPFILTSDRVAYSVDYTRRLATSRKPRRYTRATSSAHLAGAADFVRIGYQSAVWGDCAVKICHRAATAAMRRDGDGGRRCGAVGHTYAMHHCQRGWEFKARKERGKGERGERNGIRTHN